MSKITVTARDEAYPYWVCSDCGTKAQSNPKKIFETSTYHAGRCEVCWEYKAVTEPRDFGYPVFLIEEEYV